MNIAQSLFSKFTNYIASLKAYLDAKDTEEFHNVFIFCLSVILVILVGFVRGTSYLVAGAKIAFWPPYMYSIISIINITSLIIFQMGKMN